MARGLTPQQTRAVEVKMAARMVSEGNDQRAELFDVKAEVKAELRAEGKAALDDLRADVTTAFMMLRDRVLELEARVEELEGGAP